MTTRLEQATTLIAIMDAARRAARGRRLGATARPGVARFWMDAEKEGLRLQAALRAPLEHPGAWRPGAPRFFVIRDPKPRAIAAPPFVDRVAHHALIAAVEADFERYAIFDSYACRRGKGQHAAVRRAAGFARAGGHVLKMDIASYFASIPHDRLLDLVHRRVGCPEIEGRLARAIAHPLGVGLSIGALTSQHLANLYLGALDHEVKDQLGHRRYIRYMDDFLVFGEREELRRLRSRLTNFLARSLGLRVNERCTGIFPVRSGFPFVGWVLGAGPPHIGARLRRRYRARLRTLLRSPTAEASATALAAHFSSITSTDRRRTRLVPPWTTVRGLKGAPPREPWRLLEQRPDERAGRQPEQEQPLEHEEQPGPPSLPSSPGLRPTPVGLGSWTGLARVPG